MLNIQNLSFAYLDKPILKNVSFSVYPGELLHVCGANGVGKTTLIKLIAGILTPRQGGLFYDGQPIMENLPAYQQQLCYVSYKLGVNQTLTINEVQKLELHAMQVKNSDDSILHQLSLMHQKNTPCYLLSSGEKRRVALMRLWSTHAPIWLLDEPLIGLDKHTINLLMQLLEQHLSNKGIVILASHQFMPLEHKGYRAYEL